MDVALPEKWQQRYIANIFAGSQELENSSKRLAPVLKNKKTGVFI